MKRVLFLVELVLDVLIHTISVILIFGSILLADCEKINVAVIIGGIISGIFMASWGHKYTQSIKRRYSGYIPQENEEE